MDQNTQPFSVEEALGPDMYGFLADCLKEKGMHDVSPELKDDMILDLAERLQVWLMQGVAKEISEADAKELDKLTEAGAGQSEIMAFLQERMPNLNEIFEREMGSFRQTYLSA